MGDITIEAKDLGKKFNGVWGVKSANFTAKEKELTVLAGPNGAGKTTTVRILTTFYKPTKGKAEVLGMDVVKEYREIRKRIAYLPQDYNVPWEVTPEEYITWTLVIRGYGISQAKKEAKEWIELLGIKEIKDKPSRQLSGGEQRRVAVAATLATGAEVIFLDEPTVGLDPEIKQVVWKVIRDIVVSGASILLTTHDMREAQVLADKVVLMNEGITIVEDEPMKLIRSLPYQHKIIIEKTESLNFDELGPHIDLGDRVILYTKTRSEAVDMIKEINPCTKIFSMSYVELEDAYLYLISRGDHFVNRSPN